MRPLVLVADDDEDAREIVATLLESEGIEVVTAVDGDDALEKLARAADGHARVPDAMIVDFCMPNLSGIGLVRTLRRFAKAPRAILMTGFPDASIDAFAEQAGVAFVLRKPVAASALIGAVRQLLDESAAEKK